MRWIIWFLAILFYFYEYAIRVAPSVMVPEIMASFQIDAGAFGTLVAFYLYAYAPMQLPAGLLMDRYGAKALMTFALLLCGAGGVIFAETNSLWLGYLARLLMGAGSAFAFVGLVYICSHWFCGRILALMVGLGNSLGMFGAVFGLGPIGHLVEMFGWRSTTLQLGILGFILAVITFILVPSKKKTQHQDTEVQTWAEAGQNFKQLLKNKRMWVNGLVGLLFYLTTVNFAGMWCTPFVHTTYGVDKATAGWAASMIYIGWILGGPLLGNISDRLGKRVAVLKVSSFLSFVLIALAIYVKMKIAMLFVVLVLAGVFLSGELMVYVLAVELNPQKVKGSAIALTNFMVFLAGAIVQPFVGYILDACWGGKMAAKVPVYSTHCYHYALLIFPISLFLSFVVCFFLKEKKYKDHVEDSIDSWSA
ncbi:MAG: putative L-galactonate transporter [Chlamydiia bacterium]|nr:putative L-galactonate transporter [Chlamydiia bacterium]MCH9616025.1 putative L-galactonate transporter [Chlamydiia bacterium]MCH9629048.1 putative L-galactonate transporter [Chlamydiia bacterium]